MVANEELEKRVQNKLDARVRPMLQVHGGDLRLVSVDSGVIRIRFEGACVGCPLRPVTMAVTIEPSLRALEGVEAVEAIGLSLSPACTARFGAMFQARQPSPR